MDDLKTRMNVRYDRAVRHIRPLAVTGRELVVTWFNKQPHLSAAVIAFALGLLAILIGFPTRPGSTTFAGALFGSGAAFIGAWVTEKNRSAADKASEARRIEAARNYFTPDHRAAGLGSWPPGA